MTGLSGWIIGVNPIPSKIEEDELKKKAFIPISALMGALLLALVAAIALFVVEPDRAYAQANTDSSLSNLTVSVGKLSVPFTKTDYDYTVKVPSGIGSITVTGTPNIQGAQVTVFYASESGTITAGNGQSKPSSGVTDASGGTVPLPINSTRYVGVEVTALDGTSKSVYTVDVTRISGNASGDAKLDNLTVTSAVTLSPATFKENVKSYTALVPHSRTTLGVTPTSPSGASFVITSDKDSAITTADSGQETSVDLSVGKNVITIKVTAENLTTTESYKLTVTRAAANASDDAGLSELKLSGLDVDFKSSKTNYAVNAPFSKSQTTVTYKTNNSGARAVITPADFNGSTTAHEVFLGVGSTSITVTVTAANATTTKAYTLTVTRAAVNASTDAKLSGLSINAGTLSPGFNKGVMSYTALVRNSQATLGVTPTITTGANSDFVITSDKDSTITTADSGSATTVDLSVGKNVITITVTAQDLVTTGTYTLTVTRAATNASDDARLSALTVGGKSVSVSGFTNDNTADYTTGVANTVDSITIDATANHSGAIVVIKSGASLGTNAQEVGGTVDADGTVDLNIRTDSIPTNTIAIEVTAENGSTVAYYFLQITRAAAGSSSDAKLSNLAIGAGTLSPGFDKDVMSYAALVANSQTTITVTPTITSNANSTFVIKSDKDSAIVTSGSGESTTVDLSAGANVITITVTAQDLVTTETYTLTVTRAAANASDDVRLSTLTVGGESVSVSGFNGTDTGSDGVDYKTGVANGVSSIAISATANHSGAMVTVQTGGAIDNFGDTNWSVDADGTVGLSINANNILVEVMAENGSTVGNYLLQITRAPASASSDAKLAANNGLVLSGITFSPAFSQNTEAYSAEVPINIAATTITATAAGGEVSAAATSVEISSDRDDDVGTDGNAAANIAQHSIDLSGGDNVITIVVTAADYATTKTYTVRVVRGVSSNATLSSLSLMTKPATGTGEAIDLKDMDGAVTEFSADTMMYYAAVDVGVDMIEVRAVADSDDATMSVMYGASDTVVTPVAGGYSIPLTAGENTIKVVVTAEDGTTTATYTVIVTSAQLALFDTYDVNDNGRIDKSEALKAIDDYLEHGTITKDQVLEIINLYLGVSS